MYPDMPCASDVLFDVLNACLGHEYPVKRMNWPTQQSFFCKTILDAAKKRVCTLVDSFAVLFAQRLSVLCEVS